MWYRGSENNNDGDYMIHTSREQILQIGNAIEIAGNITLAAAAIFGILSIFIVLATIENEKSSKSSRRRDSGNTFIYAPINFSDSSLGYYHNHRSRYDNFDFYCHLLLSSAICSIIGTALAINFQVYWVAITVASLWTAALALSLLGRAMIDYALNLALTTTSDARTAASAPPLSALEENKIPVAEEIPEAYASYEHPFIAQCLGY